VVEGEEENLFVTIVPFDLSPRPPLPKSEGVEEKRNELLSPLSYGRGG